MAKAKKKAAAKVTRKTLKGAAPKIAKKTAAKKKTAKRG